jgi:hypothetical protein
VNRHEGIEARRHEVVAKARGIKCRETNHLRTRSLPAWSPLRACVPSCLSASINQCPKMSRNVPFSRIDFDRTRPAAHQGAPSPRAGAKQTHCPSSCFMSPCFTPLATHPPKRAKPFQTVPTRPINSIRQNKATCHSGSLNPRRWPTGRACYRTSSGIRRPIFCSNPVRCCLSASERSTISPWILVK